PQVNSCLPVEHIREMSPYQAEYWACAIPDSLPPSPDRRSPHWDPHKEYEDLLDYAYPLKPWYRLGKMPEPFVHDSGIGLDSISFSAEGTPRSTSIYSQGRQVWGGGENGHRKFMASTERFLTPRPGKRGCSGAASCSEPLPLAKELSFTKSDSSRGFAKDGTTEANRLGSSGCLAEDGRSWFARGTPCPNYQGQVRSSHVFVPSTQVLPLRKEHEDDDEFLSLPPRLRELQQLAQFLSGLSLTSRTPEHNHQNFPRGRDSKDPLSSQVAPLGEASVWDSRGDVEDDTGPQLSHSSQKPSWENTKSRSWIHRNPLQGLQLPTGLGDTLSGTSLSEPHVRGHPKNQQSESLAQCIKMFCHQLEELIRWLYSIADIPGSCIPALPDTKSMTTSLRRCLEFRKDIAEHRSLTEQVLERGEALLDCMATNSPALKDTLGLIVEQSEALEAHAEHMYKSILAAAEATQDRDRTEDDGVQQATAQWV
ncbi:CEP68 protein, partial [Rhinopomastus cyanomelas]|nr:CEP68 protein [Rhinopomastus cyanomelas]